MTENQEPGEVVTEYGTARKGGDHVVWDTAPYVEKVWPLAKRIEDYRVYQGAKVYRRRIIVVEDWTEVDAPLAQEAFQAFTALVRAVISAGCRSH